MIFFQTCSVSLNLNIKDIYIQTFQEKSVDDVFREFQRHVILLTYLSFLWVVKSIEENRMRVISFVSM